MSTDKIDPISAEEERIDHYNILITPSSELFKQTLVVMMSAIVNCRYPCHFYIMQRTWTEQQKEECRTFISGHPQNTVEFIEVDETDFESFVPWKGRFGTYYKLLAHLYLPESVDRILYMDCDSFINKDIYNYYSMDFEDNYLIGSTETLSLQFYNQIRRQGLEKHGYMNGGVVLLNIKKLKETNITKETYLNAVSKFDGNYFADQGIASYVFDGKIKLLPSYKYNHLMFQEGTDKQTLTYKRIFSMPFQERTKLFVPEYWNEEFDEKENATIVHFTGYDIAKPWLLKIKIHTNGNIEIVDVPFLGKTHLTRPVVDYFYTEWWKIAEKLPLGLFSQFIMDTKEFEANETINQLKRSQFYISNALNFCYEVSINTLGDHKFERYIKSLSGRNVALLKYQDKAAAVLKKEADAYGVDIVFTSDKAMLQQLSEKEFAECKKADVIITCCVHGTQTHERDGVKCIDIWDILKDESLTAGLPPLQATDEISTFTAELKAMSEQNAQLIKRISEYHSDLEPINQLTQTIESLHADKNKLSVELVRAGHENDVLKEKLGKSAEEYQDLNNSYNALQSKMKDAQAKCNDLQSELDSANESASRSKKETDEANREIERLNRKIAAMENSRSWRWTRIFRRNKKDEEI